MRLQKEKLSPGQNIRYVGKWFPGFIRDQPYMIFLAYKSGNEITAMYNGNEVSVFEFLTEIIH